MAASARSFRTPPSGGQQPPEISNQERLRAYDAAAASEENPQLRQQALDLKSRSEAFNEAQKQAAQENRQQQLETTNEMNERKMSAMEAQQQAQEALHNLSMDTQTKMFGETANAAKSLSDIDISKPDARQKILQVVADNPYGSLHPEIKQTIESLMQASQANQMAQQKAAAIDPIKQAAAIRGQIQTYGNQSKELDKTIADLEAENPNFSKTTGIFTDKADGTRKFGIAPVTPWEKLTGELQPQASQKDEMLYGQYQSALKQRADITNKVPQLNAQLDTVLNGGAPQNVPQGTIPGQPPAPNAAPPVPPPVDAAANAAAQATQTPPPVAGQIAQATQTPIQQQPPDIHQLAYQALSSGAPMGAVQQRLQSLGGDPMKLQAIIAANQQGPPAPNVAPPPAPAAPIAATP